MKEKRKAVALALVSIGGFLYAADNIQTLLKEEGPFFNPYSRIEERAIIFLVVSVLGILFALWWGLKPVPKKIPFGRKFEEHDALEPADNYYQVENQRHEKNFKIQKATFPAAPIEKKSVKMPLILALYAIGFSVLFYLYRFEWVSISDFSIVDGAILLGILGSSVSAIGFMLRQVYLAWSVGIAVALLQLIWFPYGTLAGALLLSQLLPAKPPAITLRFRADRWRRRRPKKPLFHAKKDASVFSRVADKRDAA